MPRENHLFEVIRRSPAPLVVGLAAMAVEFGLPAYGRFKRNSLVPTFLRVVRAPPGEARSAGLRERPPT